MTENRRQILLVLIISPVEPKYQVPAPLLACKAASLIEKETLKKRISNIEY